jgi:hypothetical protein
MTGTRDLWTFPEGMFGHDDSAKGYTIVATDGPLGECSWADYKPGESFSSSRTGTSSGGTTTTSCLPEP